MRYKYLYIISCAALSFVSCKDELMMPDNGPVIDGNGPVMVNSLDNAMPNMILVKFHEEYAETIENTVNNASVGAASRSGVSDFDRFLEDVQVESFERLFPKNKFEKRTRAEGLHLWYKVHFRSSLPMEEVARELRTISSLQLVQFNEAVKPIEPTNVQLIDQLMFNARSMATSDSELPSDPKFNDQWNLYYNSDTPLFDKIDDVAHINFPGSWNIQKTAKDVIVAVIDEGVNYDHPDLKNNMWVNEGEKIQGGTSDDDGNGYAGDLHGYDFAVSSGEITKGTHGTHVAGIISAQNNNEGIVGIAGGDNQGTGARIMTCSIFTATSSGGTAAVAEAVKYACDNGAVICQNSWGYQTPNMEWEGSSTYRVERQAYDYFIKYAGYNEDGEVTGPMAGGLVTFSAGNTGHLYGDAKMYPGAYPEFIAVASVDAAGKPAYYTNYGDWVDICAPGGDQVFASNELEDSTSYVVEKDMHGGILSSYFEGSPREGKYTYAYLQGTSQACPQVSAVAALAIQYAKENGVTLTASELRELILESTRNIEEKFTGEKSDDGGMTGANFTVHMEDYVGKMGRGFLDAGFVMNNIQARVAGKDQNKPENINSQDLKSELAPSSITLKWTPGEDIKFYKVYISDQVIEIGSDGYVKPSSDVIGPKLVYTNTENAKAEVTCELTGLRADKDYNVVIIAVNKYHVQSKPLSVSYTTAEPVQGPAVTDFKVQETGATKTILEWTEVGDCVNDPYVSYLVTCATDLAFTQGVVTKTVLAKEVGKTMNVTVTGLKPSTHYFVKVEAWDQYYLLSKASEIKEITTTANNNPVLAPSVVEKQDVQYWERRELVFKVNDKENNGWTASLKDKAGCWIMTTDSETNTVKLTFNGPVSFAGDAVAELTIIDTDGGEVKTSFNYSVIANVAPEPYKRFDNIYLSSWDTTHQLTLGDYFVDANGETLNYSFTQSGKSVSVSVSDGIMSIKGVQNGSTTLEVTATDASGRSAKSSPFQIMVRQSSSPMDVYPNPVSDVMNIRMGEDVKGNINVRVLTAVGSVVYSTSASISPFSPAQVNVSSLKSGNYIVEVTVQNTGETYKNNIVKL